MKSMISEDIVNINIKSNMSIKPAYQIFSHQRNIFVI
jgi:hypothetical protein